MAPLENKILSDHVYERLRQLIDEGVLAPGSKIRKKDLEELLGVSQTPINEALSRLAGEKFIYQENRRGYYIREYTCIELIDVFAVRGAVEGMATQLCCEVASDAQIAEIGRFFSNYHFPLTAAEYQRYLKEDTVFHSRIIKYCGNAAIQDMNRNNGYILKSNQRGLVRPPDETIDEHRALIAAIVARDGAEANRIMTVHHLRSRHRLMETCTDSEEPTEAAPTA